MNEVVPLCDPVGERPHLALYRSCILNLLKRALPLEISEDLGRIEEAIPLVRWWQWEDPAQLSLVLVTFRAPRAGRFFYDLISKRLFPGRKKEEALFFCADFSVEEVGTFSVIELIFPLHGEEESSWALEQLPHLEREALLGLSSPSCAQQLVEGGGYGGEEKRLAVQEILALLLERKGESFDQDLWLEAQHFFVSTPHSFSSVREARQLARLIATAYFFKKLLHFRAELCPEERHVVVKVSRVRLEALFGVQKVLGILVGIDLIKEHELFAEGHLEKALHAIFPSLVKVEGSGIARGGKEEGIKILYLEVEKEDGRAFSSEEIKLLRSRLPQELSGCVERWIRPLFMPRNEEEVMRNILILSQEIRFVRDLPQVIVTFEQQGETDLSFTVILLRLLSDGDPTIQELFKRASTPLRFSLDRVKRMGMLRRRYPKEAVVFRLRLPIDSFLRLDHSVDLFAARQAVVRELEKVVGEVRDYNGGMIAKQAQLLNALKEELKDEQLFLVENFFHSIFPVQWQSLLKIADVTALYRLLMRVAQEGENYLVSEEEHALFLAREAAGSIPYEKISQEFGSAQIITTQVKIGEKLYAGYLFLTSEKEERESIKQTLDF